MALRSGLAAQIGFAAETTYGTRVAPTRFLEFDDEGLKLIVERIESRGLRAGNQVLRSDRFVGNKKGASGPVTLDFLNKGMGLLVKHALGSATITQPDNVNSPTVYEHAHVIADMTGLMLTTQVGRPDVGGTVRPFDYVGCKVADWEIVQDLDELAKLILTLDARDEDRTQSLASASYPASAEPFHYGQCGITVAGSTFTPSRFSVRGSNGLKTDRHFLQSSTLKKEPLNADMRDIGGDLAGEFEALTAYERFVNGDVVAIVATWTGDIIEDAFNFKVVVNMPACRFDGETPVVGGPGVLEQPLPYKVLNNGTDEPITITITTSDSAS